MSDSNIKEIEEKVVVIEEKVVVIEEKVVVIEELQEKVQDINTLLLKKITENISKENINIKSLSIILKNVLEVVDKQKLLGPSKRLLAIELIELLFKDDEEKKLLSNDIIGNIIDLIVDASKHKININKKKNKLVTYANSFLNKIQKK
jgi:hypothetical protein